MAPLRRLTSLALGFACCMLFTSSAIAQEETPSVDAASVDTDTVGSDGDNEGLVLGGWPSMPVGDNEVAFLVYAIGNQSTYDPSLSFGVCMKDIFGLQYQSVAGTNFRYKGHGCLVQKGSDAIGACAAECAVEQLQVTIFTQEWTNTIQVTDITRLQVEQ